LKKLGFRFIQIGATVLYALLSSAKTVHMRFMKCSVFILLLALTTACSKHNNVLSGTDPQDNHNTTITGTWQWVRTDGGIGFHIHDTPQSTGKKIALKIAADGTYTVFTNDVKTAEGTYTLETKNCIHDGKLKTYIRFSSNQGFMVEKLDAQHLEVSDEYYDGVGSVYKRISASVN
jgi:hypothetical protein